MCGLVPLLTVGLVGGTGFTGGEVVCWFFSFLLLEGWFLGIGLDGWVSTYLPYWLFLVGGFAEELGVVVVLRFPFCLSGLSHERLGGSLEASPGY